MAHREDKSFTVQSRTGPVKVINQGYLKKKSPKTFMGFTQWQERFFVLETDKLLYYKTDRARSMGENPNGAITLSEIRAVSIPQDHKDGCRLDVETTSRRVYELQAETAAECQRWLNLLTQQCRLFGTLADLSDEKAVDAQHERDLALRKGGNEKESNAAALGLDPDFDESELISTEPEIIRIMEQFSLSISMDLHGYNADKIAPFCVLFAPADNSFVGSQSQPTPMNISMNIHTPSNLAMHSSPSVPNTASIAFGNTSSSSSSTTTSPSQTDVTLTSPTHLLEMLLHDTTQEKSVHEVAASCKPSLLSMVLLYCEIHNFRSASSSMIQTSLATTIWQRFLRRGATDFVVFPAVTLVRSKEVDGLTVEVNLLEQVHHALKFRQITLNTFDGMQRYILSTLLNQFWPVYIAKYPSAATYQPSASALTATPLTTNPSQLHATHRRIAGSYTSATGVQVEYGSAASASASHSTGGRSGSIAASNAAGGSMRGWNELCRTEVLPRLGKKALVVGSSSATSTPSQPSPAAGRGGSKASIIGGDMAGMTSRQERRYFDVLLGVNLEVGHATATGAEKRVRKLNGIHTKGGRDSMASSKAGSVRTSFVGRERAARRSSAQMRPNPDPTPQGSPPLTGDDSASGQPARDRAATSAMLTMQHGKMDDLLEHPPGNTSPHGSDHDDESDVGVVVDADERTDESDGEAASRNHEEVSRSRMHSRGSGSIVARSRDPSIQVQQSPTNPSPTAGSRGAASSTPPALFISPVLEIPSSTSATAAASPVTPTPSASSATAATTSHPSNLTITPMQSITMPSASLTLSPSSAMLGKHLKTLRFHVYHQTDSHNEDLNSHLLLARMECTLRDIIYSENGELTRALYFIDNGALGLSGFVHVMFHDRRRIKLSNTTRYAYRSYIFRDVSNHDLVCHEFLQESPFTFSLPYSSLARAVDHARSMRKQIMLNLGEIDASITSGKNSIMEESAKSQMLSAMQRQVKAYTSVIAQWERLMKLYYNYRGIYHGLRFKPSVEKNCRALGFLPINCHIQNFTVTTTGRSRARPIAPSPLIGPMSPQHGGMREGSLIAGGASGSLNPLPNRVLSPSTVLSPPSMQRAVSMRSPDKNGEVRDSLISSASFTGAGGSSSIPPPPLYVEASSFIFEQPDFLMELRQKAQLRVNKRASIDSSQQPQGLTASQSSMHFGSTGSMGGAGDTLATSASFSPSASSPHGPSSPGGHQQQQQQQGTVELPPSSSSSPTPPTPTHAALTSPSATPPPGALQRATSFGGGGILRGSLTPGGLIRSPKPVNASTKAVAQMIANSHAMAAAHYSNSASSQAPAFLSMSPLTSSKDPHAHPQRTTITHPDGRKEQVAKLLFTADENQALIIAATPGQVPEKEKSSEGHNLEKARLSRRVPPRAVADFSYSSHHYVNTSCGAFAAHHLGFKQATGGGMMKLLNRMNEMIVKHMNEVGGAAAGGVGAASAGAAGGSGGKGGTLTAANSAAAQAAVAANAAAANTNNTDTDSNILNAINMPNSPSHSSTQPPPLIHALLESGQKILHQQWELQQRVHVILSQAMTAMATSFVSHLLSTLHQEDTWKRILRIGYLQQVESLLSTFHSEQYMLQDMSFIVRALEYVKITCIEQVRVSGSTASAVDEDEAAFGIYEDQKFRPHMMARSYSATSATCPIPVPAAPPSPPDVPAPSPTTTTTGAAVTASATNPSPAPSTAESSGSSSPRRRSSTLTRTAALSPTQSTPHHATTSSTGGGLASPGLAVAIAAPLTPLATPTIARRRSSTMGQNTLTPMNNLSSPTLKGLVAPTPSRNFALGGITINSPGGTSGRFHAGGRIRAPAATGPAPADDDFVSAQDDVAANEAGVYPSVLDRLSEIHQINVSLLLPITAAPVCSLPYTTDPPGQAATIDRLKKTKWFSMLAHGMPTNSGGPSTNPNAAQNNPSVSEAALAGAEAAARAAVAAMQPGLPHPYSAGSVIIAIELPPYLYKLLPACLRDVEPRSTTNAGSAGTQPTASLSITSAPTGSPNSTGLPDDSPSSPRHGPTAHANSLFTPPTSPSLLTDPNFGGSDGMKQHVHHNSSTSSGASINNNSTPILTSSDGEAVQLSTPLIDVCPLLITQGVNEMQTMANKVGSSKTELQQQINLYSIDLLNKYFLSYSRYQKQYFDEVGASSKERLKHAGVISQLARDLQACELMIHNFNSEKNIQLLVLCADLVKRMSGGRIVGCKSAKDRTSMAVTWDQARVLYEQHGLSEHDVQSALNLMRTEGVRKLNVIKNCFPEEDHEILTKQGFMNLSQVKLHFMKEKTLAVACYVAGALEYHSITYEDVTMQTHEQHAMVEIHSASNEISIHPTRNHRMWTKLSEEREFRIHSAHDIFQAGEENINAQAQFNTCFEEGFKSMEKQVNELPFAHLLSNDDQATIHFFLRSLGDFLSNGSTSTDLPASWMDYFASSSVDPVSTLSSLMHILTRQQLRSLIEGMSASSSDKTITITSLPLRDLLLHALLHAGYTTSFEMSDTPTPDSWRITYTSDSLSTHPSISASKSCHESIYNGTVWCVTVPTESQLIMVRRVLRRDDTTGDVLEASRPVIVGNTGQSAYAFNVIQRSFLPAIFRPPENACSSSIDG